MAVAPRSASGIFVPGAKCAGTVPGYRYSDALTGSPVVWDGKTIDRLFEIGPAHFAPGTKMPMQQIAKLADRQDLVAYLRDNTGPKAKGENQ